MTFDAIIRPTEFTALVFIAYFLAMLVAMAAYRSAWTLRRGKPPNSFRPDGTDLDAFGRRLTRVHANSYESLPIVLTVLLFAIATDRTEVTDGLAIPLLALRTGQIATHLTSSGSIAVLIRFLVFFTPQLVILIYWTVRLLRMVLA